MNTGSHEPPQTISNIEILRRPDGIQFTVPWKSRSLFYFHIPFTLLWNFMILGFIREMFSTGQFLHLLFFGGVSGTVGIIMIYFCLSSYFNKTTIRVTRGKLEITHGPWYFFSENHFLNTAELEQFFVKKISYQGENGNEITFELWVKRVIGKDIQLLSGYSSPEQLELLEKEIEQFLEIKDNPAKNFN